MHRQLHLACGSVLSPYALAQACCGLEESGVANEATWQALLGDKMTPAAFPVDVGGLLWTSMLSKAQSS